MLNRAVSFAPGIVYFSSLYRFGDLAIVCLSNATAGHTRLAFTQQIYALNYTYFSLRRIFAFTGLKNSILNYEWVSHGTNKRSAVQRTVFIANSFSLGNGSNIFQK